MRGVFFLPKEDQRIAQARNQGIEQFLVNVVVYDDKNLLAFVKPDNYRESLGGHVKEYESILSSAKREAKEESGLDVKIDRYLGHTDFYLNNKRTRMFFVKGEIDFKLNYKNLEKKVKLSDEHKGYLLIPFDTLNSYKFKHDQKAFLAKYFMDIRHEAYIRGRNDMKKVA